MSALHSPAELLLIHIAADPRRPELERAKALAELTMRQDFEAQLLDMMDLEERVVGAEVVIDMLSDIVTQSKGATHSREDMLMLFGWMRTVVQGWAL